MTKEQKKILECLSDGKQHTLKELDTDPAPIGYSSIPRVVFKVAPLIKQGLVIRVQRRYRQFYILSPKGNSIMNRKA